jgi:heptosyltransferase-2
VLKPKSLFLPLQRMEFKRILIIQTAFIGDVVLATPLVVKLHRFYPDAKIDFLLRKGNEMLLEGEQRVNEILIWNKGNGKNLELIRMIRKIRRNKYDLLLNIQRFSSMGLLSFMSGAKHIVGFDKNPFSFCYHRKVIHSLGNGLHEVNRNLTLIEHLTDGTLTLPELSIKPEIKESIRLYQEEPYWVVAPTSVWFTKQYPAVGWIEFLRQTSFEGKIYLIGASGDHSSCEMIRTECGKDNVINLCGKTNLMQSAALVAGAQMNYVNDSAPLHFASAFNAPVTAMFCSTVPEFGFGPLSDQSNVVQLEEKLDCRPCGLHGFKKCPKGHFKCGDFKIPELVNQVPAR